MRTSPTNRRNRFNISNRLVFKPLVKGPYLFHKKITLFYLRMFDTEGLFINYGEAVGGGGGSGGGGATKWENRRSETFCTPPQDGKTFRGPLLKSGNLLRPPPSIWLKLQATT